MKTTISIILGVTCAIGLFGAPIQKPQTNPEARRMVDLTAGTPSLTPLQSAMKRSASEVTKYILVDEHFDNVCEGSEETPSQKPLMSQSDFFAGRGIDQTIISGGTWTSENAYPAGGAVALICPGTFSSSYINTPIADYSGEITVTFKVKPLEHNGERKGYVEVAALTGDFRSPNDARTQSLTDMSFNLYAADKNWTEVEIKFNNYSSNNDGFIQINCYQGSAVLIDDLKITTSPTFVADPVLLPASFGPNTVTARWQPVRRAFNYYLRLYEKHAAGDGEASYEEDFDNLLSDGSNLPEGWSFNVGELRISEDGGFDNSKGVILKNGETLETFRNGAKYKNASVWLKAYYPSAEAAEADMDALVCIDVAKDDRWIPLAGYYMNALVDEPVEDDMLTLAEMYMTEFADRYDAIRVRIKDCSCPEAYVVADHFYIETGQPLTYELIEDKEGYDYSVIEGDSFELKFDNSDKNYPYHGLKQDRDYAYSLQAHYLFERSEPVFADLAGVYTPVVAKPEETDRGFTASWEPVYAASSYRVDNYGVKTLKSNTPGCIVFDEKFTNTVSPTTSPLYPDAIGNSEITDLSEYSDLPGWGGLNNVYVNGMMGFTGGYLVTPLIHLPNAESAIVRIVYQSTPGDVLTMTDADGRVYYKECTGAADMNRMEAEFTVPTGTKPVEFTIRSMYRQTILIDEFTVLQDAKAGNKVYTYIGSTFEETPSVTTAFSDLTNEFTGYALSVTALRDDASGMLFSAPSTFRFVGSPELFNGESEIEETLDDTAGIEGYYTVSGVRLSAPVKGINIVRMTDGTVKKVIVK